MLRNARLNIRAKMLLGYFLIICCLGAAVFIVSERISILQNEIETIADRDIEIHNLITALHYNAISMQSSQRGYVITGDEAYLVPYYKSKSEWEANYNILYPYLSGEPNKRKSLEEIKLNIENWIAAAGEPVIALRKANKTGDIIRFFAEDTGKLLDIDQLRQQFESLRQSEIQSTQNHLVELKNRNHNLIIGLYAMLVLVSAAAILIVSAVSGAIVKTIKQVVASIKHIASSSGDLSDRIRVTSRDEVYDLAAATNLLLDNVDSENWIQTKVAEVATMSQGINDLETLADSFLTKLAPILDAVYGVFYIRQGKGEQQRLVKVGAYASAGEDAGIAAFRLGEGLIGQAALENRTFLLNAAPGHPIRIQSGLAQLPPQSILVVPIAFKGQVAAVAEFASAGSFTSQHLKLLEQIERHFGAAINGVLGQMEVERLLGESQVLTEELLAQTEELQAQSEELQLQQEQMRITTKHLEEQNLYAERKTKELEKAKAELESYSERLRQSSQYKSNFLANMSHELRTPLNSILILSQLLSENDNRTLTDEEEGYAKAIYSSGNDLLALINDILDLSKIEAGKVMLTMDEVNVSEIPEHMRLVFQPVAEKKGLSFMIEAADHLPPVLYSDGQRLQQILKNLLANAFKFTETGSVTLSIQNAGPSIVKKYLPQHADSTVLSISVTDTGIGIPEHMREQIFEAFQQADSETTRQYGGTGLGLSICHAFTNLLDGRIVLESVVGHGSTFTLLVPSRPNMEMEQLAIQQQEAAAGFAPEVSSAPDVTFSEPVIHAPYEPDASLFSGKKVLLAEDDARNVFSLVKALESKSIIVTVAGNGKHCLDILEQRTDFDLVLMDIMMPVMDGFEAMRAIRRMEAMAVTPIIALTAQAMKNDRDKCLEAGASGYISKPLDMEQLFSLMRVWLTKQAG